jgi:hypothetical protein
MLPVPQHFVDDYGVPPSANQTIPLDRWALAYTGSQKAQFLTTLFCMQIAGALPAYRRSKKYYKPVSHEAIAAMAGLSRTTVTERLKHFRTIDAIGKRKDRRLETVTRSGRAKKIQITPLIHSDRGFQTTNRYSPAWPTGMTDKIAKHAKPGQYVPPNPSEILASQQIGQYVRPETAALNPCRGKRKQIYATAEQGFQGANGFFDCPAWIWHPNTPLSWTARLVLTMYVSAGLLQNDNRGHLKGFKQWRVACASGLTVSTVEAANRELKDRGICRAFSEQVNESGCRRRTPQQVLYLPIRQFTKEESERELQRHRQAMQAAYSHGYGEADVKYAQRIHQALIEAWTGKEHQLSAFHNEYARQLHANGVNRRLINILLGKPPT